MERPRTDLACEAKSLWEKMPENTGTIKGVRAWESVENHYRITVVEIEDEQGEKELCKPIGRYVTVDIDHLMRREDHAFQDGAAVLAHQLQKILRIGEKDAVLVAGLGNDAITPDAIGPIAVKNTIATRHLFSELPDVSQGLRSVTVLETGVLGTTGIESAELISSVVRTIRPAALIAVDALATADPVRICRTVQISDTGIVPGSGVGNGREEISEKSLGIPVIAVGVPTVVDALTLAREIYGEAGAENGRVYHRENYEQLMVTPKDIDKNVADIAKLIGYSINLALQPSLTLADVDLFLS